MTTTYVCSYKDIECGSKPENWCSKCPLKLRTNEPKGVTMIDPILKPCPCGKIPTKLHIMDTGQGGKYADVCGDCCADWKIEFRQQYASGDEAMTLAIHAWNIATRSTT